MFDAKPHKTIEDGFHVTLNAWMLGEAAIGYMASGGQYFDRSRKKIARDSMDGYLLQFYLKGQSEDRHGSHLAQAGDLYVLDMAQPLATTTTECAQISLVLPRRLLAQHLKSPDASHGQVISSQEPLVMLLRDTLVSFYNNIDKMTSETAEGVLRPVIDLAAMAINSQIDEEKTGSLNVMLFSSIRRHIDRHLLDPDLTVESVMQVFGLSRRTLYRMFEPVGGFSSYVQEQRLRRSYDALRAADMRHLPISTLAAMHGFVNPEVFTRAFRRVFTITPREARHLALSEVPETRNEIPETAWSRWIVQMGR
ncbi:helix-turn-helix domain-containing protein [Rhizobium oryzicola]|uniref:Helix-turn-helix domain-containing protein n=1 Tax=Rhizobium oryzicola TaxID=1232668 RepID=A0ABT8T7D4_9HYPH|nr:helix-turn-helix domain-containing protein [Rhizobium oryzicola]MDO1585247.1 helix-turn-helix domain-containing protein [Rhizobium oryzicola]